MLYRINPAWEDVDRLRQGGWRVAFLQVNLGGGGYDWVGLRVLGLELIY